MDFFLLGLEIIFPVFLIVLIGLLLERRGLMGEAFMEKASSLVFYYALPVKLFLDVYKADLRGGLNFAYCMVLVLMTLLTFFLAWGLARLLVEKKSRSAFVHTSFRSNFIYVGLPILSSLLKSVSHPAIISVNLFIISLYNFLAIGVLSFYRESRPTFLSIMASTLKNPLILGTLGGMAFSLLSIPLPKGLFKGLELFSSLATPLALLLIGMELGGYFQKLSWGPILAGAFCVLIRPIIALPLIHSLSFSYEEFIVAFVLFSTPSAANSYVMTKKMGGNGDFAAQAILASFLLNLISFPLLLSLMENIGWIHPL